MPSQNFLSNLPLKLLKKLFGVPQQNIQQLAKAKNILLIRQHNQFGDMIASVSIFRAIKETFPDCKLTVIASKENFAGIVANEFVDELFVFDKKKFFTSLHFLEIKKFLKVSYDFVIVPVTVSISFTSCLLAALANSEIKIGPASLNGKENKYAFMFTHRLKLDWRKCPDTHVADFILEIVRPFNISTKNFNSSITITNEDKSYVDELINSNHLDDKSLIIGLHIGAGKPQNRWEIDRYVQLIERLNEKYSAHFFLTGTASDNVELLFIKQKLKIPVTYFIDKKTAQVASIISHADLFITNDTGTMHIAGSVPTPQISIFGPTNPFNWAPIGNQKYFLRKSDLINDISVDDVFNLCEYILAQHKNDKSKK